jgi:hypothetical protein
MHFPQRTLALWALPVVFVSMTAAAQQKQYTTDNVYFGRWALTIPGGGAGWLGIEDKGDYLAGSILWGGGSVVPLESVYIDEGKLIATRINEVERKDKDGKVVTKQRFTETIEAYLPQTRQEAGSNKLDGPDLNALILKRTVPNTNGKGAVTREFTGKRIADLPEAPNLKKVKYADPIQLFNGKDISGWTLTNPGAKNGWVAKDGILTNSAPRQGGAFGNLRTEAEYEDFNLKLEVRVPAGGNSGVYLRGIYEVQVEDSYGKGLDSHHMGALYSRITPSESAEKPAGEWQTMDITLVDRHLTVILNGKTIIDNQPVLGCTGGALWSDEFKPGPIYLQGDHGSIEYRNIVLTPVKK